MLNRQGRPTGAGAAADAAHPTFTGNKALAQIEPLIFEIGHADGSGVDLDEPEAFTPRLGGLERKEAIGLPGLSEPETMRHYVRLSPAELRHRYGPVSARLLHHEAQCAFERAHGAPAGFRRRASAPAGLDRAGGARTHERARSLSPDAHRHDGRGAVAEGGSPWRAVRHDGHQGRHRREGRGRDPQGGAGARFRSRHEPGDRRPHRFPGEARAGPRRRLGARRRREGPHRTGRRRHHAHEPQYLRPLRAADRGDRQGASRCGGLLLLRRRELQRHRRQGEARRSRRRRHAHQPAQDLLDAARRRRAGFGSGRALGAPGSLCARAVRADRRTAASNSSSAATGPARRSRSAGSRLSTARWACMCGRCPTCSRTARTA